jgi:hypothetical protein
VGDVSLAIVEDVPPVTAGVRDAILCLETRQRVVDPFFDVAGDAFDQFLPGWVVHLAEGVEKTVFDRLYPRGFDVRIVFFDRETVSFFLSRSLSDVIEFLTTGLYHHRDELAPGDAQFLGVVGPGSFLIPWDVGGHRRPFGV